MLTLGIILNIRHWENKNYTPIVKQLIEEKIREVELKVDDYEMFVDKVDLTGEVIIKKKRQA